MENPRPADEAKRGGDGFAWRRDHRLHTATDIQFPQASAQAARSYAGTPHREECIPQKLAFTSMGAEAAQLIRLVFDSAEAVDASTLRLKRLGMPGQNIMIIMDLATLEWRAAPGSARGRGWIEAAACARGGDRLGTAAMLYAGRHALRRQVA